MRVEAAVLRRERASLQKRLNVCKNGAKTLIYIKNKVNDVTFNFILSQIKWQNIKPRGRRFSLNEKILAVSLMKQSGKCYRLLSRIFALPSRNTLLKLLSKLTFTTGINEQVIQNKNCANLHYLLYNIFFYI